jgi:glycosyltransferase involved in cell wall biosynthesis
VKRAPIRVLYVSPGTDTRGGAERSLLGLIDGLDRADVEPSAVVLGKGSMVEALRARGVVTTTVEVEFRGGASYSSVGGRVAASWPAGRSLVRAGAVVRGVMERERTQVVHSNGMRGHVLLPLLRRRGVATVASIRDLPRSRYESVVLMAALRSADTVIATSEYVGRQLRFTRNVQVIDNPVCAPELPDRDEARESMGVPRDAFVVAMLAHFHRWKGHLDLLRAVEPLEDTWVLLAGGDLYGESSTECRNELLSFARSSGFAHRVHCVGAVDDVGPVYAAADVVAHCSIRPEPFGRTVAEAMLSGKPVVASSAGAPGEFVSNGRTGLLFAPGNSVELREHLVSLHETPELRRSLAYAARDEIGDRFEPRDNAAQVLEVYEESCGSRSPRRPEASPASPADHRYLRHLARHASSGIGH